MCEKAEKILLPIVLLVNSAFNAAFERVNATLGNPVERAAARNVDNTLQTL